MKDIGKVNDTRSVIRYSFCYTIVMYVLYYICYMLKIILIKM